MIQQSLFSLLGLPSLPSACGLFFSLDALSVNRWRTRLLAFWLVGRLDIDDFRYALSSMRHLPTSPLGFVTYVTLFMTLTVPPKIAPLPFAISF